VKTRRLTATHEGVTYARVTHRPYACVVVYQDESRRPTWHETLRAAERAASLHPGTIVPVREA
jgi:hypothetical protein